MHVTDPRAELLEANVSAFLLAMGGAGGGDERHDAEITWTIGGSPLAYHNAVVHCDAEGSRSDALIDEWTVALRARALPGSWHVSPRMRPSDLVDRLLARGFDDGGDEPAMAADLTVAHDASPAVERFTCERVADAASLDAYRQVLAGGFGEGPPEAEWVAAVFKRIGLGDDVPWRHYVGRRDGAPVSTVTLFLTPPAAGVYFVCTSPDARNQGIGAATTQHSMQEARRLGCTTAVLGSSPMGYGVYARLGFEVVFRYRIMEWSP